MKTTPSSPSKAFVPGQYQPPLDMTSAIVPRVPTGDDVVPLDVVFVGAGPAGLSGAIELARLVQNDEALKDLQIGVLEKAATLGGHNLSGSVVNPRAFRELFPDLKDSDFPFRKPVTGERVYMLTKNGQVRLPTPPPMNNHGNSIASICEMVRWLGQKAEELGVNVFTSFPADALLTDGAKVVGVRTTPMGLKRDGQPGPQATPPTEIAARFVVLSEGTRGPLTQAYLQWQKIQSPAPQIYALGVKEIWRVPKATDEIIHTLGWPLASSEFGGSFAYPLADDLMAFGLVVGLDYKNRNTDVHQLLQQLKAHPLFQSFLKGGEAVEWGAKTIPEGGYYAVPDRVYGDGVLILGDCAGLVNVPALKGIHYAMTSGIYAARALYKALKAEAPAAQTEALKSYDTTLRESFVMKELYRVRHMRHAFKSGFFLGGAKSALMIATGGAFPSAGHHELSDADEPRSAATPPAAAIGLKKVDAVYLSGNKTRDDIPPHLTTLKDLPEEVVEFYTHVCPAGVYEKIDGKLQINAPNCVDCKATDVLGPRWRPREGGSGPSYKMM
jgi:electron-transferring-flavoprotein dehydrogenase